MIIQSIANRVLVFAFFIVLVLASGCATRQIDWTRTTVTDPDGVVTETNRVTYNNKGFDTALGVFKLSRDESGSPTLTMENLKSEDMTARAMIEMAQAVKAMAEAAP